MHWKYGLEKNVPNVRGTKRGVFREKNVVKLSKKIRVFVRVKTSNSRVQKCRITEDRAFSADFSNANYL